jgi:hypothetical protein
MALKIHMVGTDRKAIGSDSDTGEVGNLIRYINGTGATSVKGNVFSQSTSADNKVILQANEFDAFCVCAESGIASDAYVWCWEIGSSCQVLFRDGESSTRGYVCLCSDTDGRALNVDVPSTSPVVAEHFKEIGHVAETKSGGTNVLVLIHTHYN